MIILGGEGSEGGSTGPLSGGNSGLDGLRDVGRINVGEVLMEENVERHGYFEGIDLLSCIDKNKLLELQSADLVLVYRDNNRYRDMAGALSKLVDKYGKKVYCVSIPQGTEKLSEEEYGLLKTVLNTCKCMTDVTVSEWVHKDGIICDRFESKSLQLRNQKRFLWITENLEEKFKEQGIDTVYVYTSYLCDSDPYFDARYQIFDHGCMCERQDGSKYFNDHDNFDFINYEDNGKQFIEDAKRFRKNIFPSLNVLFIENHDGKSWDGYKTTNSVLIADRHSFERTKPFLGKKIYFAGDKFEPDGGIGGFISDGEYQKVVTDELGESIMETVFGGELVETINPKV